MKRISLFLTIVLFTSICILQAQTNFTNGSFEQWNNQTNSPVGWNTISLDVPMLGTMSLCSIEQSNQSQDGKYSLLMKAEHLSPMITSLASQFMQLDGLDKLYIPSVISNGKFNISMNSLSSLLSMAQEGQNDMSDIQNNGIISSLLGLMSDGLDVKGLPDKTEYVSGYYNFQPESSNENVMLAVLLTKTEDGKNTLAGGGIFSAKEKTNGFTQFSIPITYLDEADNLYFIGVVACMDTAQSETGSLRLDNICVNGTVSLSSTTDNNDDIFVYPNPATDKSFRIMTSSPQRVVITNIMGQKIKEIPSYNPQEEISLDKSGIYLIQIAEKTLKINIR